jgi:hypothetical protein
MGGLVVDINGSIGIQRQFQTTDSVWQSALDQGLLKIGDQMFRNISKTGDLSWKGQVRYVSYNTSNPNYATVVTWVDITISMNPNGKSFEYFGAGNNIGTWYRQ